MNGMAQEPCAAQMEKPLEIPLLPHGIYQKMHDLPLMLSERELKPASLQHFSGGLRIPLIEIDLSEADQGGFEQGRIPVRFKDLLMQPYGFRRESQPPMRFRDVKQQRGPRIALFGHCPMPVK